MALTDKHINDRLGDYGPLWKPKSLSKPNIESPDGFATAFMDRFGPHFAGVAKQKAPRIDTYLGFINQPDVNALAVKLYNFDYLIGLNKGLIEEVLSVFYDDETKKLLRSKFPAGCAIDESSLPILASYFAVAFAFYHEFSHVFQGHLAYRATVNLRELNVLEMAGRNMSQTEIRAHYLTECHADTHAGWLMAAPVWQQVQTHTAGRDRADQTALEFEVVAIAGFALGVFFRILEDNSSDTDLYPPAPVRNIIIQTKLGEGIENRQKQDGVYRVEAQEALLKGLSYATALADTLNLAQAEIDAAAAAQHFLQYDAPEVDALEEELKGHRP